MKFILILAALAFAASASAQLPGDLREVVVQDSTSSWYLPKGAQVSASIELIRIGWTADSAQIFTPRVTYTFDCGQWENAPQPWGSWVVVKQGQDSLIADQADWKSSGETIIQAVPITGAKFCPCGCPSNQVVAEYRVDDRSKAVQRRTRLVVPVFRYAVSDFQKSLRAFQPKKE